MKHLQLLTLIFLSLGSVWAQSTEKKSGKYSFTLKQALSHAIQNNVSVINANRDIASAKHKKWETTASGLPQLNASFDLLDNLQVQRQGIPAVAFNPSAPVGQVSAVGFGVKYNAIAKATLQQLIFDGSYLVGLQAAKTFLQYSENARLKTESDVKEMVINAYGNVLLTDESILVLQRNKTILEKNYKEVNEIFKNGLTEEESVEQIAITLSTVENALNYSKRIKEVALNMLKISLGLSLQDELVLVDKLENLTQENIQLGLLKENFNISNNIDYKMLENNQDKERLLLKLEKSKMLPTLSAMAYAGYNTFDNQFNMFSASHKWYDFAAIGVSLNVPIFSSFKSGARIQQAKIAFEKAKTQLDDTSQKIQLSFQKAKSDYEYSIEKYISSKKNLELAQRIETKQQVKFKEGLSTSFEFTEAQRQLYAEQQNYLQAMLEVITKRAELEKIINK